VALHLGQSDLFIIAGVLSDAEVGAWASVNAASCSTFEAAAKILSTFYSLNGTL
jgi:hypothetical protein